MIEQKKWMLDSSQRELFPPYVRLTFYLNVFFNHNIIISNQEGLRKIKIYVFGGYSEAAALQFSC